MPTVVPLTQGFQAIIDDEDATRVLAYKWHAYVEDNGRRIYAARNESYQDKRRKVRLHRFILDAAPGTEVDHRDGDGLNNQRANLRLATRRQNARNVRTRSTSRSGRKGVSWDANTRKWHARINVDGRCISLGYFANIEDASAAYAAAAVNLHGDFAKAA